MSKQVYKKNYREKDKYEIIFGMENNGDKKLEWNHRLDEEVSRQKLPSFIAAACGFLFGIASRSYPPRPSRPSVLTTSQLRHPRVNVYLCIKQALFIRPMNMHCLVAVARCRVQTRRYHCLINHIQSHRPTLCHLPPFPFTVPYPSRSSLSSSLSRTRRGDSLCHPSLCLHVFPLALVVSPFSFPAFPQLHCFALSPANITGRNWH